MIKQNTRPTKARNWQFSGHNYIYILDIVYILVACLSLFLMGTFHIPINDDLSYHYVFYDDSSFLEGDGDLISADTFGKIVDSQVFHYFNVNGRSIVHFIIQFFAGILGNGFYTIFSPFLLALTLILFIRYTCPAYCRKSPAIWAFACIIWIYLYPSPIGSFHWLAYGMNYLYPMCLTLGFLLYFRHICDSTANSNPLTLIITFLLGFITGWSQEGFALPLSGAMLIYIIFNWRKINKPVMYLIIGLWLGSIIMTISPGNFIRMSKEPLLLKACSSLYQYIYLRGFIVAWIIILLSLIIHKNRFVEAMLRYAHVWFCLIFALLFGLIAKTGAWSLISVEFYAFIITATLLPSFDFTHKPSKAINIISSILLILIIAHQSLVITTAARMQQQELDFIERSKSTTDGITPFYDPKIPPLASPWIYDYTHPGIGVLDYQCRSFAVLNNRRDTPIFMISEKDYDAISNPDKFFTSENLIPGSANFYDGEDYYWIKASDYSNDATYTLHYAPPKLSESPYLLLFLKILFTPNSPSFVKSENLNKTQQTTIPGNHNDIIAFKKQTWRTVTSITKEDMSSQK